MDEIDKVLRRILQKDAQVGTKQLASETGLSVTAAKRRVNRLRRDGIIKRDIAMFDPERVGFSVFTLVFVTLERDRRDIVHSFKQAIQKTPQILQGFYTTGDADFILLVASRSMTEYEEFTQDNFSADNKRYIPNMRRKALSRLTAFPDCIASISAMAALKSPTPLPNKHENLPIITPMPGTRQKHWPACRIAWSPWRQAICARFSTAFQDLMRTRRKRNSSGITITLSANRIRRRLLPVTVATTVVRSSPDP